MKPPHSLLIRLFLMLVFSLSVLAAEGVGQTLNNASLSGKYFFRHVQFTTDTTGAIAQASSLSGAITFDGQGKFTARGQQTVGSAPPANLNSTGTYQVQPNGFLSMTNPQRTDLTLNARFGVGALVGSSTEAAASVTDVFIAIPAPGSAISNGSFSGPYQVATLELPLGNAAQARNTFFSWNPNGQGGFAPITVTGHAANLAPQVVTQTITGATYTMASDGSATAVFPLAPGVSTTTAIFGGQKALFLSSDGSLIIGGSTDAGVHDLVVGVKTLGGTASNSSLSGLFFTAGMTLGSQGISAYAGSANSPGNGSLLFTRRFHALQGTLDFTGAATYALGTDGTGTSGTLRTAVGAAGGLYLNSAVSELDTTTFGVDLAIRAPAFSGSGVFVNPAGIVNASSFAPIGAPVAPGELFTIFGTGLATQPAAAAAFPLPLSLNGVQVLVNGSAAPLIAVQSPQQISAVMPVGITGGKATIVVNNNGASSNSVDVPLAKTAPGIFSAGKSGLGPAIVFHSDNVTPVSSGQPAKHGEIVVIYLTGLGATTPPVGDRLASPTSPPATVSSDVTVYIGGKVAPVVFKGLVAGFAALYQVNVTVPNDAPSGPSIPLAIGTADAFHDQVDIAVQ